MSETTTTDRDQQLPHILYIDDLAAVLRRSRRSVHRLRRAKGLPDPLSLFGDDHRPCWSRDTVLEWLRRA